MKSAACASNLPGVPAPEKPATRSDSALLSRVTASRSASALRLCSLAVAVVISAGCKAKEHSAAEDAAPSASAAPQISAPRPSVVPPLAGERVEIPAGAFTAGSRPGEAGRDPQLEQRQTQLELGAFSIDRLPYPNDPTKPPLTNVSRDEASKLCGLAGARLCTELEWERACRGPDSSRFSTGDTWEPSCADEPRKCASPFGVLGLGAALQEWTASDIDPEASGTPRPGALRGASRTEPAEMHRCATRRSTPVDQGAPEIGFRCCKGPPNAAVVPEPKAGDPFQKAELSGKQLEKLLKSNPVTARLAQDLVFFSEPEAANTVVSRGPGDRKGFGFTVRALRWNPVAGANYLLVTARSGKDTSFVVAYRQISEEEHELAGSFIMEDEPGPVAFAYSDSISPRLHFSSCWGCPGETGKILFRKPDDVSLLQP